MRKVASHKRWNAVGVYIRGYAKNREGNAPLAASRANNPCGNNYRDLCYLQM
ncbi:hypothetical protein WH47_10335 [Habropoda laboriosa]|uniref:Uncharacterized protein n=1 Tax=Habropoda laboriosa TaxID=597456 RepID=A0A0L7R4V3_9HYME|nr:hypothetical protein WH47_10335 [Habropoda laboriosa]